MPKISLIIPALNEAENFPAALAAIRENQGVEYEVIVVDAQSIDNTVSVARDSGATVVVANRRQRAHQLNLGADSSSGEFLLFLHADTQLPIDGLRQIAEAMEQPEIAGGAFGRFFDSPSRLLRLTCRIAIWRSRRLGIFLGDQGIFVRRSVFEKLGGFDENRAICEDLDFSRRMRKLGKTTVLPGPLISSARRFERRGPFCQTLIDLWLTAKYFAGR